MSDAPKSPVDLLALRNALGVGQGRGDYVRPRGAAPVVPPTFPRSKDDLTLRYYVDYKAECKPPMAAWTEYTLAALDDADEQHARSIAYDAAKKEIGTRGLYHPEYRLLCECTRDFLVSRHGLRTQAAEARR